MNKAFNKVIKSHVVLAVLTVFMAVLLTTTVTYSLYQLEHKNTKNQTIAIGDLSADMTSITGAMILEDLYPEEATKITDDDKKYQFTLTNDGTYDLKYEIYLMDATDALLTKDSKYASYKRLSANHYKYINYKFDGKTVANLESIKENDKFTILKGELKAGTSEDHYLQFFLDSKDTTTTGAPNDINGSVLSLDIYMDAAVSDSIIDDIIASAKSGSPSSSDAGLYKIEDASGDSYYYKGDVKNNYVKFAGLYWRIVRINEDGTLKLMYDGTSAYENGTHAEDDVALTDIPFNENVNDNKYAGFMYGVTGTAASTSKVQATANTNDSTIKQALDTWYENNILNLGLSNQIVDKPFCNDRSTAIAEKTWAENDTALGYGENITIYGANKRLINSEAKTPSLKCLAVEDSFSVDKTNGNGNLKYPIGLLSADELALAAGNNSYINKHTFYWTMTPSDYNEAGISIIGLDETGNLTTKPANTPSALVPVLNVNSDFINKMIGTGGMNDPYRVE